MSDAGGAAADNPLILQYSDGQLVPYQVPDPAQAAQRALDFTGIPDLVSGANTLARGEYLPGLGQAASGAAGLLPLGKLAGAAKLGAELMPLGGLIKAWHGTPHLFEPVEHNPFGEFRDAAIGSGEGAQAYGHGHYVAGNRGVAEGYQRDLAGNGGFELNGEPMNLMIQGYPHSGRALQAVQQAGGDFAKAQEALNNDPNWMSAAYWFKKNAPNLEYKPPQPGSLLEVHILPDEYELLDWDRPLAEQPPGVKKGIDQVHAGNEDLRIMHSGPDITGANFYRNLANQMWDKTREGIGGGSVAASKALHEAGIPGIKYLDQGSRDAGAGTSNYVIFDPKNLRIVGRNGQRLEPVEEDPFK